VTPDVTPDVTTATKAIRICVAGLRGIPGVMGGIESHCEQVFPRLKALGGNYDITVIGRRSYIPAQPYEYKGLRVVALPTIRNKYLEAISNTAIAVLYARFALKSDILHIHGIGPALMAPLARALGMRVVVTHHGKDFEREKWSAPAKAVLRLGERVAVAAGHRVIVVSRSVTEELRRRHPALAAKISYVPNGMTEFPEARGGPEDGAVLTRFGVAPGRYILAVGRLVPEKGFHDLIAAFKSAQPAHKLLIVGKADHENAYSRGLLAEQSDRVVFGGFQGHDVLKVLYRQAALFVLPSTHEGLPISALEAASQEAPILLSDIQPNLDIELAAANYFPVGDVAALSAKLRGDYASYRVDRQAMAARFDWGRIAEATERIYAALAPLPDGDD